MHSNHFVTSYKNENKSWFSLQIKIYFTLASKTILDFHWCNNLTQCYTLLPDELQRQKYSPKYEFSHLFSHTWPRNRLCASLTEQALRTCLGVPGSEWALLWLTVASGHMADVQPSPVNPMDNWKASRPGSPCNTNHSPLDEQKVGRKLCHF